MSYAFRFDASACTGCKACQAACKDKNNLPVGVLWRRVIEVSGGDWSQSGAGWTNDIFSYNLSMACNHCVHPKCAGVCPTNAYHVREDGIVILDSSKCIGCGYCNWACPYAVPQYDHFSGVMSKCNFCFDDLEAGREPACVAACPMRVLDFEEVKESGTGQPGLPLWELPGAEHPFPLPNYSRTQPHLRLNPHPGMLNDLEKVVANREEIKLRRAKNELPLVFFTLLIQMAVGVYWFDHLLNRLYIWNFSPGFSDIYQVPTWIVGVCLTLGMLISFAHLGKKQNAWRALGNLDKSWLSREILFLSLFETGWLLSVLFPFQLLQLLTACLGFGLIYGMANVYRLRSMSTWNTWRTLAAFLLSAILLGLYSLFLVHQLENLMPSFIAAPAYPYWVILFTILMISAELFVVIWGRSLKRIAYVRIGLSVSAVLCLTAALISPNSVNLGYYLLVFLLILAEEISGRWLFYSELDRRIL